MVHSVSGWTWGVQVNLRDRLKTCAIPERVRDVFMTRRYAYPGLPYLTLHQHQSYRCTDVHIQQMHLIALSSYPVFLLSSVLTKQSNTWSKAYNTNIQNKHGSVHQPVQSAVNCGAVSVGSSCQQKHHLNSAEISFSQYPKLQLTNEKLT